MRTVFIFLCAIALIACIYGLRLSISKEAATAIIEVCIGVVLIAVLMYARMQRR